ncbi:NAD(P)/FAD-dependent oxidoreductase [Enterovirga sp. GCM10030262]|uniref:NAD(P)/FAD-dependent oxidoreductase n=1 Tax=Enterovirga sp. GCM10030262 TaxID=3273391 RepID=UPI0036105C73
MSNADFIVIGAGVAGLSAAARLARHGRVAVVEAEDAIGYHSSGRSATFSHYGIGDETVRGLTAYSRRFFEEAAADFSPVPLSRRAAALFIATEEMLDPLDRLHQAMARFTDDLRLIDAPGMKTMVPILKTGRDGAVGGVVDPDGLRLDADALLQGYARAVRGAGGTVHLGHRISTIERQSADWRVRSEAGEEWRAPILVNAAGAWADAVAATAGVRPLRLEPKRRTIIVIDPPPEADVRGWPFVKTVVDDFYLLPEAGKLIASPVDEVPSEPSDCQPEDYDIALAASKVEQYTILPVRRIAHSWAGLRSFVADRVPTAGFAADAPGFFWLAGQGGYGLQTAPAMAEIAEALVTGGNWPSGLAELEVTAATILPERLDTQQINSPSVRLG